MDLYDRLKAGLNQEYITWLSYFPVLATTYMDIVNHAALVLES